MWITNFSSWKLFDDSEVGRLTTGDRDGVLPVLMAAHGLWTWTLSLAKKSIIFFCVQYGDGIQEALSCIPNKTVKFYNFYLEMESC